MVLCFNNCVLTLKLTLAHWRKKNIVSRSQIKQLEDGGDSSFYSPEIKYQIGKKVLASLGHRLAPVMAPQQVVTAAPSVPAPQPQVVEQPDLTALKTPAMAQATATATTPQQGDVGSNKVTMGLLLIAGLCGLAWFLLQSGTLNEPTAPSQHVLTKTNVPETAAAPPAPEPVSVAPGAANTVNNVVATTTPTCSATCNPSRSRSLKSRSQSGHV